MIAFPDPDSRVPCALRSALCLRHGGYSSSYLHVRGQLLDLFGRDCQFYAGILLKIIGQKLFHGIPSFNLCAVLINVVNIVGKESGERFSVSLVVSLFVFSGVVISRLICRGRLILSLASGAVPAADAALARASENANRVVIRANLTGFIRFPWFFVGPMQGGSFCVGVPRRYIPGRAREVPVL